MIRCKLGCAHEYVGGCELDCERCKPLANRSCDVAAFVFDTAPDCRRTFLGLDIDDLTGFTTRAAAALIHLREAWCNADPTNRAGVAAAIASLMSTRSLSRDPERYEHFLRWSLDEERGNELINEVKAMTRALIAAGETLAREKGGGS